MKFLIYVDGNPGLQGYTRFEFKWSQQHGVYLWEGKETEAKDFDSVCAQVFGTLAQRYRMMAPKVKIAPGTDVPAAAAPRRPEDIPVELAEEVMERWAPHRLKKKTGPKPSAVVA